MLTAKQYEAVGRLTITFNDIDQMLDMWLPDILGNPEPSVAFLIAGNEMFFKRKIEFSKKLLKAILDDQSAAKPEIDAVSELLEKAKALNGQRNQYVHSVAFVDYKERRRKLRTDKGVIECNEDEVMALADKAGDITVKLSQAFQKLQTILIKLRCGK